MTKSDRLINLCEMSDAELHHSLSRKARIHDMEVSIRNLRNKLSMCKDPEQKKSLQDRIDIKYKQLHNLKGS